MLLSISDFKRQKKTIRDKVARLPDVSMIIFQSFFALRIFKISFQNYTITFKSIERNHPLHCTVPSERARNYSLMMIVIFSLSARLP